MPYLYDPPSIQNHDPSLRSLLDTAFIAGRKKMQMEISSLLLDRAKEADIAGIKEMAISLKLASIIADSITINFNKKINDGRGRDNGPETP